MSQILKRVKQSEIFLSVLLIGSISLLAYAPLLNQLGFYREDWYIIWSGMTRGAKSLIPMFTIDRPFVGYLYALAYSVLGNAPLPWHIYALALRLFGIFSLLWLFRMVWPEKRFETTMATLLFAIYPGFLQQPQANTYQFNLTALAMAILSIALTIRAVRADNLTIKVILVVASLPLTVGYLMTMEYFIGLEVLRILLLWVVLRQEQTSIKRVVLRLVRYYAPYLAVIIIFIYWRTFFFQSDRPAVDVNRLAATYATGYLHYTVRFIVELARDIFETLVLAWTVPFNKNMYIGTFQEIGISIGLALLAMAIFYVYNKLIMKNDQLDGYNTNNNQTAKTLLVFGTLAALFALIPIVAAGQDVKFVGREDRFTLSASIGAACAITGLIVYAVRPKYRHMVIVVLIGLAIITHFNHTLYMRNYWRVEREVWWQLSWRAPDIQGNSMLIVNLPSGYSLAEDNEVWAPVNMIYAPDSPNPITTGEVIYDDLFYDIQFRNKKPRTHRGIWLNRHFENSLVLSMPTEGSCLQTIGGNPSELSIFEDPRVRLLASYSRIERITLDAPFVIPPEEVFGQEPQRTWCYYYQKASYYRQAGMWEEVARVVDEAFEKGFKPRDLVEWMPVFEAYANLGRDAEAQEIATVMKSQFGLTQSICLQFKSGQPPYPGAYQLEKISKYLCQEE